MFDFPIRDIVGNKMLAATQEVTIDSENLMMRNLKGAIRNISDARTIWKARFDAKHQTPTRYHEGDLVLLECPGSWMLSIVHCQEGT